MRERKSLYVNKALAPRRFLQSGSGRIGKVLKHVKVILRRKHNVG